MVENEAIKYTSYSLMTAVALRNLIDYGEYFIDDPGIAPDSRPTAEESVIMMRNDDAFLIGGACCEDTEVSASKPAYCEKTVS